MSKINIIVQLILKNSVDNNIINVFNPHFKIDANNMILMNINTDTSYNSLNTWFGRKSLIFQICSKYEISMN